MRKIRRFLQGRLFGCALLLALVALGAAALAIYLPRALAPLALAERVLSLAAGILVALSSEIEESKTMKLLLLVLLPWTGAVLCVALRGRKIMRERTPSAPAKDLFSRCRAQAEALSCGAYALAKNVTYFPEGRQMFNALLLDLQAAKRTIYLEYYILAEGKFWGAVLSLLEQKAKAGVTVKLIYDDFGCALTLPKRFEREMKKRGIACAAFRKLRFPTRAAGRRDHRKLAVIDGEIAYTGGINLADEYTGEKVRFGHWKDSAVRVTGAPAWAFSESFARAWQGCTGEKLTKTDAPAAGMVPCLFFCDGAGEYERAGALLYSSLMRGAEKTLYLTTPYLAPDSVLFEAFRAATAAGVDVRLLIPRIPDKKTVYSITCSYARELEQIGVKVRAYTAGFMHAKNLVADGALCVISSYNLDFRSMYMQAECGLLIQDKTLASAVERDFLTCWETSSPLPNVGRAKRRFQKILRLFAPLI